METGNNFDERQWPKDVGIIGIEVYFPAQFVDQGWIL